MRDHDEAVKRGEANASVEMDEKREYCACAQAAEALTNPQKRAKLNEAMIIQRISLLHTNGFSCPAKLCRGVTAGQCNQHPMAARANGGKLAEWVEASTAVAKDGSEHGAWDATAAQLRCLPPSLSKPDDAEDFCASLYACVFNDAFWRWSKMIEQTNRTSPCTVFGTHSLRIWSTLGAARTI